MPSSFLTSPSSSASSHLSYLIPASARPPPLAMGQGYGGATGGIGVPTGGVVATNALNAAAAALPPPRQQGGARNAGAGHPPLPRPPPRQCPRCKSANTKFCYYNNYSREQPRYLCKACRRHWTEGGTLRDVPVGGGRKNRRGAKGSAKASASAAAAATQGGNVLGVGADTFPDLLRQLVQFPSAAAVGGGGYAIDLGAWRQMSAATAPPPQGTGDASTLGAAGAAAEAEANSVALQYWSEWQQYGMPGLDGAC
ncbi:unnamed protein product [Miscanthus lutarioriparius]|uniref:Dof zinc finger protein n=1 Tax=Miscanthus lutarioriparius TaxID=422564 RepID=A0A811MF87_9POAL|nr:unnamed protein product [Miscanthus lutarioriparius]